MAVIELTELYPHLLPELNGCPKPLVLSKIRDVLIHFFEQTQAWTEEIDRIPLVADIDTYDLDAPSLGRIETIKLVTLNGVELVPYEDYVMPSKGEITLINTPVADSAATDDGLEVEVVMKPRRDSTQISKCIYEDHYQTWVHGVLSKLQMMSKKAWTDLNSAKYHDMEYWDGIAKARVDQNRLNLAGPLRAQPRVDWLQ